MRALLAVLMAAMLASACTTERAEQAPVRPLAATPAASTATGPKLVSSRPLYLRVVFGENSAKGMLVVIDESRGDGLGYDTAYFDQNMDGDLTNDTPAKFAAVQRGDAKQVDPEFAFTGPCPYKEKATVEYRLSLYSLAGRNSKTTVAGDNYFFWWMTDAERWSYFFINGKFKVYSSAAEALAGQPIQLAGKCKFTLTAKQQEEEAALSVGLVDPNGCTLRTVSGPAGDVTPTLTLIDKAGKPFVKDKKLEFG